MGGAHYNGDALRPFAHVFTLSSESHHRCSRRRKDHGHPEIARGASAGSALGCAHQRFRRRDRFRPSLEYRKGKSSCERLQVVSVARRRSLCARPWSRYCARQRRGVCWSKRPRRRDPPHCCSCFASLVCLRRSMCARRFAWSTSRNPGIDGMRITKSIENKSRQRTLFTSLRATQPETPPCQPSCRHSDRSL
jgi:hypothetical protein